MTVKGLWRIVLEQEKVLACIVFWAGTVNADSPRQFLLKSDSDPISVGRIPHYLIFPWIRQYNDPVAGDWQEHCQGAILWHPLKPCDMVSPERRHAKPPCHRKGGTLYGIEILLLTAAVIYTPCRKGNCPFAVLKSDFLSAVCFRLLWVKPDWCYSSGKGTDRVTAWNWGVWYFL